MIYEYDAQGSTIEAIRYYKKNKDKIGYIFKVVLEVEEEEPILSLYDDEGEGIRIISGLSSMYGNAGVHGLIWILNDAGINVDETFIYKNKTFNITRRHNED